MAGSLIILIAVYCGSSFFIDVAHMATIQYRHYRFTPIDSQPSPKKTWWCDAGKLDRRRVRSAL